jgi:hypothetical protein
MLMGKKLAWAVALTCISFLVELPGIEPAAKSGVTCGNAQFDDAKQREST